MSAGCGDEKIIDAAFPHVTATQCAEIAKACRQGVEDTTPTYNACTIMDSTASTIRPELTALSEACATFDPSQRDQRMVIRLKVVPMLTRKLDDLRVALRANAHDESIQPMIDEITRALNRASVRLDCTFNSATDALGPVDETRMEAVLATLGARRKPMAKRNLKLDSNSES